MEILTIIFLVDPRLVSTPHNPAPRNAQHHPGTWLDSHKDWWFISWLITGHFRYGFIGGTYHFYKAYFLGLNVRGCIAQIWLHGNPKYGFIWYSTSSLGTWNGHWRHSEIYGHKLQKWWLYGVWWGWMGFHGLVRVCLNMQHTPHCNSYWLGRND